MPTVHQSNILAVRAFRPAARCTHQRDASGWRMYQVVDDAGPIGSRHYSPVSAWREAREIVDAEYGDAAAPSLSA